MEKKINILLISPFFFPTNRYQQELCKKITELYPNIKIHVLCYQITKSSVKQLGKLHINYVPCYILIKDQFVLPNYIKLIKTLLKIKKEGIHFLVCETRFFDSTWWLPIVAKIWRVPSIVVEHCASPPKHSSAVVNLIGKILDKFLIKLILKQYSMILCSNTAVCNYLSSLGINNLKLIGTGVNNAVFNPNKRQKIRRIPKLNIKCGENDLIITFASRLIYTKGVELFYQSVKPLIKKYPNLKIIIAGEGPLYEKINCQIILEKMCKKVYLTGSLTVKEMAQLFANTDIFVHPSFHHDGIPNVILEAGISDCAVIASNSGGTSEIIKNNITGILLKNMSKREISEAVEYLIINKKKRLALSKALHLTLIHNYSWQKAAQKFINLINDLRCQY